MDLRVFKNQTNVRTNPYWPLIHFDVTLNVLRSGLTHFTSISSNPMHDKMHLAWVLLPFSMIQFKQPLFSASVRSGPPALLCLRRFPFSRFGYLLNDVKPFEPRKLFVSNTLGILPFRVLLLSNDWKKVSLSSSTPALYSKTLRLWIGASAVYPHQKSRAPVCILKFISKQGQLLSWVF